MSIPTAGDVIEPGDDRRLITLERLLALPAIDVTTALDQANQLVARELDAEKVDAFLLDTATGTLVAAGMTETPMLNRERAIGLDRLPLVHDGMAEVFASGVPYLTGHAEGDPRVIPGFTKGLGIRSMMIVPFDVNNERRGVLQAVSTRTNRFSQRDLHFLQAVSRWMGMVAHKAELVEEITREAAELGRRAAAEELITILAHDLRN
jgi:GAF domain-containing protein